MLHALPALDSTTKRARCRAAAALGRELATNPHGELAEAMARWVRGRRRPYGPPPQPVELVEVLARVHRLFDLAPTEDSVWLGTLVAGAGYTDLVLDTAGEAAYHRTVDRSTPCKRCATDWLASSTDPPGGRVAADCRGLVRRPRLLRGP